ncbi:hypothetical protein E2C01_038549 [Portunus trituberculatus]|uniref:Uncharacterized protein n=1 Tax=Portunus trituberculatus TaxID=210409 RepID=A0A5B7FIU5_PORTR|nr:hypothetical protein [Portunus trituberculatus]
MCSQQPVRHIFPVNPLHLPSFTLLLYLLPQAIPFPAVHSQVVILTLARPSGNIALTKLSVVGVQLPSPPQTLFHLYKCVAFTSSFSGEANCLSSPDDANVCRAFKAVRPVYPGEWNHATG